MAKKAHYPVTAAIRVLRQHKIDYIPHLYTYEERGGTSTFSKEKGVNEYTVIKTLVMQDEAKKPVIVLMHGDKQVSTKQLARQINKKSIVPCLPAVADKHSGYQVGGTSPFGTRQKMPVYIQETILELEKIYINGGKRGFLIEIHPQDVATVLQAQAVSVAID